MARTVRQKILVFFIATGAVLFALCTVLWLTFNNAQAVNLAQEKRHESFLLADELRQSSDDLTRLVRTYIVTGDNRFKQYYDDIVAIREGRKARPENYRNIYWDFVTSSHQHDTPEGNKISITVMMQKLGFTAAEMAKLEESKRLSDDLIEMEVQAMNALSGRFKNGQGEFSRLGLPNEELARKIVHGQTYHRAKAKIMLPISDFTKMVEARTNREVSRVEQRQNFFLTLAVCLSVVLLLLFTAGYIRFKQMIVTPLARLTDAVNQMEGGDYQLKLDADANDNDELGTLSRAFLSLAQIIEAQLQELQYKAEHDSLTGTLTKQAAEDRLEYCLRSAKHTGSKVGVLFLDINDFKQINDKFGHLFGDRILQEVAHRCQKALRETDFVCRVGGDEFMIILPNIDGSRHLKPVCNKLDLVFSRRVESPEVSVFIGVSIGGAVYPDHGKSIHTLIKYADKKMYAAKRKKDNSATDETCQTSALTD